MWRLRSEQGKSGVPGKLENGDTGNQGKKKEKHYDACRSMSVNGGHRVFFAENQVLPEKKIADKPQQGRPSFAPYGSNGEADQT